MEAAWFGLGGVIVGALIAICGEFVMAVRREAREDAAKRAAEMLDLRMAVRLVDAEFLFAAGVVLHASKNWDYWQTAPTLATAEYERYKATLAMHMPFADWDLVRTAAVNIGLATGMRSAPESSEAMQAIGTFIDDMMAARLAFKGYR